MISNVIFRNGKETAGFDLPKPIAWIGRVAVTISTRIET